MEEPAGGDDAEKKQSRRQSRRAKRKARRKRLMTARETVSVVDFLWGMGMGIFNGLGGMAVALFFGRSRAMPLGSLYGIGLRLFMLSLAFNVAAMAYPAAIIGPVLFVQSGKVTAMAFVGLLFVGAVVLTLPAYALLFIIRTMARNGKRLKLGETPRKIMDFQVGLMLGQQGLKGVFVAAVIPRGSPQLRLGALHGLASYLFVVGTMLVLFLTPLAIGFWQINRDIIQLDPTNTVQRIIQWAVRGFFYALLGLLASIAAGAALMFLARLRMRVDTSRAERAVMDYSFGFQLGKLGILGFVSARTLVQPSSRTVRVGSLMGLSVRLFAGALFVYPFAYLVCAAMVALNAAFFCNGQPDVFTCIRAGRGLPVVQVFIGWNVLTVASWALGLSTIFVARKLLLRSHDPDLRAGFHVLDSLFGLQVGVLGAFGLLLGVLLVQPSTHHMKRGTYLGYALQKFVIGRITLLVALPSALLAAVAVAGGVTAGIPPEVAAAAAGIALPAVAVCAFNYFLGWIFLAFARAGLFGAKIKEIKAEKEEAKEKKRKGLDH